MTTKVFWTAAILVALKEESESVNIPDAVMNKRMISERIGISMDYIEQLAVPLIHAGLIKSKRGLGGGFILNAETVTLKDVMDLTVRPCEYDELPKKVRSILDTYNEAVDTVAERLFLF